MVRRSYRLAEKMECVEKTPPTVLKKQYTPTPPTILRRKQQSSAVRTEDCRRFFQRLAECDETPVDEEESRSLFVSQELFLRSSLCQK